MRLILLFFICAENDVPDALASALGNDDSRYDGIWIFASNNSSLQASDIRGHRCKRKASTKQMAQCVRSYSHSHIPAKVPQLPPGAYVDSCSGCRVILVHDTWKLTCSHCDGAKASATDFSLELSACEYFDNVEGQLACGTHAKLEL